MKDGLLPLTQDAIMVGKCSYHDFQGVLVNENEKEQIARDLGPNNKVMFLRNHGVVTAGATIEEAWGLMQMCISACEMQVINQFRCLMIDLSFYSILRATTVTQSTS